MQTSCQTATHKGTLATPRRQTRHTTRRRPGHFTSGARPRSNVPSDMHQSAGPKSYPLLTPNP